MANRPSSGVDVISVVGTNVPAVVSSNISVGRYFDRRIEDPLAHITRQHERLLEALEIAPSDRARDA